MPKLEQKRLANDLHHAQRHLTQMAEQAGKEDPAYHKALKHFAQLWFVLRMTRSHDEFLKEVINEGA